MDERACWDNSVWSHPDPISQRWPSQSVETRQALHSGWKFFAIVHHFPSEQSDHLLSWSARAICSSLFFRWADPSQLKGKEGSFSSKTLLPDESSDNGCQQQLAFISYQSRCEGQPTNLMHHVRVKHTSDKLAHWNLTCFVSHQSTRQRACWWKSPSTTTTTTTTKTNKQTKTTAEGVLFFLEN